VLVGGASASAWDAVPAACVAGFGATTAAAAAVGMDGRTGALKEGARLTGSRVAAIRHDAEVLTGVNPPTCSTLPAAASFVSSHDSNPDPRVTDTFADSVDMQADVASPEAREAAPAAASSTTLQGRPAGTAGMLFVDVTSRSSAP
jgi:hypothetical protein